MVSSRGLLEHAPGPVADPGEDVLRDQKRCVVARQVLAKAIRRRLPVGREIELLGPAGAVRQDLRGADSRNAVRAPLVAFGSDEIPTVGARDEPERVDLALARLAAGFLVDKPQPLAAPKRLEEHG